MTEKPSSESDSTSAAAKENSESAKAIENKDQGADSKGDSARRKIPGNLPYTSSVGSLTRALEKIPVSEKPAVFNSDFLGTVLGITGGASRPVIPILKACGLISQSGNPTELYSQFQTEGGRNAAALEAMKKGFAEIFKRNQFAHKASEDAIRDIIVAVTGLPKSDNIVRYMQSTFLAFQKYAREATDLPLPSTPPTRDQEESNEGQKVRESHVNGAQLGLVYNINIVLPETTNIDVYNTIFRSLKGNLMQ